MKEHVRSIFTFSHKKFTTLSRIKFVSFTETVLSKEELTVRKNKMSF